MYPNRPRPPLGNYMHQHDRPVDEPQPHRATDTIQSMTGVAANTQQHQEALPQHVSEQQGAGEQHPYQQPYVTEVLEDELDEEPFVRGSDDESDWFYEEEDGEDSSEEANAFPKHRIRSVHERAQHGEFVSRLQIPRVPPVTRTFFSTLDDDSNNPWSAHFDEAGDSDDWPESPPESPGSGAKPATDGNQENIVPGNGAHKAKTKDKHLPQGGSTGSSHRGPHSIQNRLVSLFAGRRRPESYGGQSHNCRRHKDQTIPLRNRGDSPGDSADGKATFKKRVTIPKTTQAPRRSRTILEDTIAEEEEPTPVPETIHEQNPHQVKPRLTLVDAIPPIRVPGKLYLPPGTKHVRSARPTEWTGFATVSPDHYHPGYIQRGFGQSQSLPNNNPPPRRTDSETSLMDRNHDTWINWLRRNSDPQDQIFARGPKSSWFISP